MGRKKKAAQAPAQPKPEPRPGATRIARAYMGDGNTGPVEGGLFPALEIERYLGEDWAFCGRHVGRQGQTFAGLQDEAMSLHGLNAEPREGWDAHQEAE